MYSHSYASPLVNWIGHFWRMCPYTESSSKGLMIPLRSWFLSPPDVRAATLKVTVGGTKVSKLGLFLFISETRGQAFLPRKRTSLPPFLHGRGRAFLQLLPGKEPAKMAAVMHKHRLPQLAHMRCEDRTTKFNGQLGKVKAASASHFHASAHSASVKIL